MTIGEEQGADRAGHHPDRLQQMFDQARGGMALITGDDHRVAMANRAFLDLVGVPDAIGSTVTETLPGLAAQGLAGWLDQVASSGEATARRGVRVDVAGPRGVREERFIDFTFHPLAADAKGTAIFVQAQDATEARRSEALRIAHDRVLELAVADAPLAETLAALIGVVESTSQTGVLGSILLLDEDGQHLRAGAAPSLPPAYSAALDGAAIGPAVGSCGTAAFTGRPVFVSDIATDPLWTAFRDLAMSNGLRACWSTPILIGRGRVLGTFAMYHRDPREPTVRDLALVDLITQTAALVIARDRAEQALSARGSVARRDAVPSPA